MSKVIRPVIACPPERPVLHAGDEIDWMLECCIQQPEERTTWAALTDALEESSWTHEEAVRCVRRCRLYVVRCQCVARAVRLLTVGPRGRGYRLACDLVVERTGTNSQRLPIVVIHGPDEPAVTDLVRAAPPDAQLCVTVGDRWIRSLLWSERYGLGRGPGGRHWWSPDPDRPADQSPTPTANGRAAGR